MILLISVYFIIFHIINSNYSTNKVTWCRINWDTASRQLTDDISLHSIERSHAPLIIPTQHELALLVSDNYISLNFTVSYDTDYMLSSFPCDINTLSLSIRKRFTNEKFINRLQAETISKAAKKISTSITKSYDNIRKYIIFEMNMNWTYSEWKFSNWNFTLVFHETINNINITSQTITIMNVPQSFKISGTNEEFNYLYGEYSLSLKAQFTLFSSINTNGIYFQDPSNGTTVFTFIYMGYIYPMSQWVFFNNYGELAKPTIASNQSINNNFFKILPVNKIFIDNDANEYILNFNYLSKVNIQSDRIYNPYLECSVTQYLVNYLSSYKFVENKFELNLKQFNNLSWYNIPQCIGKRCIFGIRLNRFDHFLMLEYNDYEYNTPQWKLLQSWMFCWSLEFWLTQYQSKVVMNETDELPTTIHYLPVSDCSLNQVNILKKKYGANKLMTKEYFEPWLNGLLLLIKRVIQIKDKCRVDPLVLSLSRQLWGAIGQCGDISYVDFDPQIFGYVVTDKYMNTNLVEWMKIHHLLSPSTKLGNEQIKESQILEINVDKKQKNNTVVVLAIILVVIYSLVLVIYLGVKYYRLKCYKYESLS
eukprot:440331_1